MRRRFAPREQPVLPAHHARSPVSTFRVQPPSLFKGRSLERRLASILKRWPPNLSPKVRICVFLIPLVEKDRNPSIGRYVIGWPDAAITGVA